MWSGLTTGVMSHRHSPAFHHSVYVVERSNRPSVQFRRRARGCLSSIGLSPFRLEPIFRGLSVTLTPASPASANIIRQLPRRPALRARACRRDGMPAGVHRAWPLLCASARVSDKAIRGSVAAPGRTTVRASSQVPHALFEPRMGRRACPWPAVGAASAHPEGPRGQGQTARGAKRP
jgi:hypothetical protein